MKHELTDRQKDLKDFLVEYKKKHDKAPLHKEMMDALGVKSKSGIDRLLSGLEERGHIKRLKGRKRAVTLL